MEVVVVVGATVVVVGGSVVVVVAAVVVVVGAGVEVQAAARSTSEIQDATTRRRVTPRRGRGIIPMARPTEYLAWVDDTGALQRPSELAPRDRPVIREHGNPQP